MNRAIMYSKPNCPYCVKAEHLLKSRGYEIEKLVLGADVTAEQLREELPNARTVPQIFLINEEGNKSYVGGYDQLKLLIDNN